MINESKKKDIRSWDKWDQSGATTPSRKERAEKDAEIWLQEEYRFNLNKIPSENQERFLLKYESFENRYNRNNGRNTELRELIERHPELTEEELSKQDHSTFGTTNNFWQRFFPEIRVNVKTSIESGKIPANNPYEQNILYWQMKELLIPAFKNVGFDRIKRMHESLTLFLELDKEWKTRLGANPDGLWYGSSHIPESKLISEEEKQTYKKANLETTNTLRRLSLELAKEGVPFLSMY
ncbi:hypothetical protein IT087_03745 [Candidatus Uhrbacteria bacterium]|nr:hypothetical protein [Candidatus Uhrbacteria bacterium]